MFLDFPLYAPQLSTKHPSVELDRAQLLSIIDRLLAQEEQLCKLERKQKFRDESSNFEDLKNLVERNYGFLRRVWTLQAKYEEDPDVRLDRLNKTVSCVRSNLLTLLSSHRKKMCAEPL